MKLEYSTVIVDDEASSLNSLKSKITQHCPRLKIVGECLSPEEGIVVIDEKKPNIVFLDVEMPRVNGFVLLQQLKHIDFELIFTTAYEQYAIEAIKVNALDYLLKPVEVEGLKLAVERAYSRLTSPFTNPRIENLLHNMLKGNNNVKRIALPTQEGLEFIDANQIMYLEAFGNYTLIYLMGETKMTISKSLKDFEDLLPVTIFIRIHHSYIINKDYVVRYLKGEGGQVIMQNGKTLDVARRKKEDFLRAIDKI